MKYYDIHTHRKTRSWNDLIIFNHMIMDERDAIEKEKEEAPFLFKSAGIHPWYVYNVREQLNILNEIVLRPAVVAIGEAGFDKLAKTPLDLQYEVFLQQVYLAEKIHKPLIIHCVKAWSELIMVKNKVKPKNPWIIHGFRGNGILADQLISHGFYLSFGKYYNQEALKKAWPDYLLTETDDKDIEIREVYRQICSSLQIDSDLFASQVRKNVHNIFPFDFGK